MSKRKWKLSVFAKDSNSILFHMAWQSIIIINLDNDFVENVTIPHKTIIDSDNGLSPGRCRAIIWTDTGILLIGPLGTNVNEILIKIRTFSFKKMLLKMSSAKWRPFCLDINVLSVEVVMTLSGSAGYDKVGIMITGFSGRIIRCIAHWSQVCGFIKPWSALVQGNGLLPIGTKPLPKPTLSCHRQGLVAFCLGYQTLKCFWKFRIWYCSHIPQGHTS